MWERPLSWSAAREEVTRDYVTSHNMYRRQFYQEQLLLAIPVEIQINEQDTEIAWKQKKVAPTRNATYQQQIAVTPVATKITHC